MLGPVDLALDSDEGDWETQEMHPHVPLQVTPSDQAKQGGKPWGGLQERSPSEDDRRSGTDDAHPPGLARRDPMDQIREQVLIQKTE